MAITPDAIEKITAEELSADDTVTVARLENEIDTYLLHNYVDDQTCAVIMKEPMPVRVAQELLLRYRDVGWTVFISPSSDSLPSMFFFHKNPLGGLFDLPQHLKGSH